MPKPIGTIAICSCDDTMPLDAASVSRGCPGADIKTARQLCRAEIGRFQNLVSDDGPLTVACTQEAPLFAETAAEAGKADRNITFVNVRETAGWSREAAAAGPKMAALIAAAQEPMPPTPVVTLESSGVLLIYGTDDRCIEAATLLETHLDVTVLIRPGTQLTLTRAHPFPIVQGQIRAAKGHLGRFEVTVDDFALPAPSSRQTLVFGPSRNGATSHCDVVLDLSGGRPLFTAAELRDGYVRAAPDDHAAVLKAVLEVRDLTGTFEKPRYATFAKELCAHSRSKIVGCTRCLEVCPTGAIAPAGNHVEIDAAICAGCGQCAVVCPTGAASYALPPSDALLRKLRTLLRTYQAAGGTQPVILLHDQEHGAELIDALARLGDGLPPNVLPLALNEVTQVGLETIAAAFAYGSCAVRFLLRGRARTDAAAVSSVLAMGQAILGGLGFGGGRVETIETDDPDALGEALRAIAIGAPAPKTAAFLPTGSKRDVTRFALRELHAVSPRPVDVVALPAGAPFGGIELDAPGCTLCLSCVSACPTGALTDDPERPLLRFAEDACVQCGLCKATCPEHVISLQPRIDFHSLGRPARVLKEEEPFCCIRCGKPFGVKSTIERVTAKLSGTHWMYKDAPKRLDAIKMCEDCRIAVIVEDDFDPHDASPRPPPRTTDDYLREREQNKSKDES
jgi:ferredoxin